MNKPDWTRDPALLAYLKALQEPTANVTPMPGDGTWNNHPKLNPMQHKFYQEQQHMMRTEWQLMQERRMQEERELTAAHVGGDSDAKNRVAPVPAGIAVASTASIVIGNAGTYNNGTYGRAGTGTVPIFDWVLTGYIYRKPDSYFDNTDGRILFAPNSVIKDFAGTGTPQFGTPYGSWTLVYVDPESDPSFTVVATNASTYANYIPTSGWSPAITIVAA